MSLGALGVVGNKQGRSETRLIQGGAQGWVLDALLGEARKSTVTLDPAKAELIYDRIMTRHQRRFARDQRWIRRMGRTLMSLMAAVASSRAFRVLTP